MFTTKLGEFKGEIRNYLLQDKNNFDFKIDRTFSSLKMKTWLCKTRISKSQGYPASQLLFVLFLLPILKLKTVNSFCSKKWYQWSAAQRDSFYRFKHRPYRWRSFFYKVISEIASRLNFDQVCLQERYFVIDDSVLPKRGKQVENVSFIYDHCLGRSVLGFSIVTLGLFTGKGFYPLDFSYRFSSKRHPKSAEENIGNPISSSGQRSFEAKQYSKLDLALMMLNRALSRGLNAGYVLFDSWYACPYMIRGARQLNKKLHVICRLKESKVLYRYHGKKYSLSQLHSKVRNAFRKDKRTGLLLNRVTVRMPGSDQPVILVFAKGYCEPEQDSTAGAKKAKQPKWVAFLSTDCSLHAATIIKKYIKRWSTEVCYKECKQLLDLGKEQGNKFEAQVSSTTLSFLRYAVLNYLNETESRETLGALFANLVDDVATITYAQRLWDFFRGLFQISLSKIFALFEIEDDVHSYLTALDQMLEQFTPILGCET